MRYFGVSCRTANDARAYMRAAEASRRPAPLRGHAAGGVQPARPGSRRERRLRRGAPPRLGHHLARAAGFRRCSPASTTPHTSSRYTDFRGDWSRERLAETTARVDALRFLETPDRTLAQAAIAFCLSQPAVSTVISGAKTPAQVEENAAASDRAPLSDDELRQIAEP